MSILITNKAGTSGGGSVIPTTSNDELYNVGLATSVASGSMTVALKQSDGISDPGTTAGTVSIGFRSSTNNSGAYAVRATTSPLNIVIPSGATLGTASGNQAFIWVYALDNGTSVELGVSQSVFDEGSLQLTTAISSSANSNALIYSTVAHGSTVPVRIIGRLSVTLTTAGTWIGPNQISIAGPATIVASGSVNASYGFTGSSITAASNILFTAINYDSHNAFNTSTGGYSIPISGIYRSTVAFLPDSTAAFALYKNGTLVARLCQTLTSTTFMNGSMPVKCIAGDVLSIQPSNSSTVTNTGSSLNYLTFERVGN